MLTVTGAEQEAIPPVPPEQENVTVTGELFQPAVFGDGVAVAVISGGLLGTNASVRLAVALFPAESVAVPETT